VLKYAIAAVILFTAVSAIWLNGRNSGVKSERAVWVERQHKLAVERDALKARVSELDRETAMKDAQITALNRKIINAIPKDNRPGLDRAAAQRLRDIR
jgi:hypothetical protein